MSRNCKIIMITTIYLLEFCWNPEAPSGIWHGGGLPWPLSKGLSLLEATPGLRLEGGPLVRWSCLIPFAPPLAPGQLTELLPQGLGHTVGKPMVFFFFNFFKNSQHENSLLLSDCRSIIHSL